MVDPRHLRRWVLQQFAEATAQLAITSVVTAVVVTAWVATRDSAPSMTSLGWLIGGAGIAFGVVLLAGVAGWAKRQWTGSLVPDAGPRPSSDSKPQTKPDLASRLYVGEMGVDANKLKSDRILEIWVRCFNATGHSLFAHRVTGNIELRRSTGGSSQPIGKLPPAIILSDRSKTENLPDATEMFFVLEQRVPEEFVNIILGVTNTDSVHMTFLDHFSVIVASHDSPTTRLTMPLWGGIRLYRNPERILAGRITIAKIEPIRISLGAKIEGKSATG